MRDRSVAPPVTTFSVREENSHDLGRGREDGFALQEGVEGVAQVALRWLDPALAVVHVPVVDPAAIHDLPVRRQHGDFRCDGHAGPLDEHVRWIAQHRARQAILLRVLRGILCGHVRIGMDDERRNLLRLIVSADTFDLRRIGVRDGTVGEQENRTVAFLSGWESGVWVRPLTSRNSTVRSSPTRDVRAVDNLPSKIRAMVAAIPPVHASPKRGRREGFA